MLAPASAQVDRGRGALTALAPKPGQDGGEGQVAVVPHQEADGDDGLTPAAVQLKLAMGPVA
jgi:hypothetical protein